MADLSAQDLEIIQRTLVKPQLEALQLAVSQTAAQGQREVDGVKGTLVRIFERMDGQDKVLTRIDERTAAQAEKSKELANAQEKIVEGENTREDKAVESHRWKAGYTWTIIGGAAFILFELWDKVIK